MKLKVISILGLLIVLSAVMPVYYYYADKEVSPLPPYHTYDEIISKKLPEQIKTLAAEIDRRGYILPISNVEGDDDSFPYLKEDLNLALAAYRGWTLLTDAKVRAEMKKRLDKNIEEWRGMFQGNELMNILNTKKKVVSNTQTSAAAKWFYLKQNKGDNVKIVLTVRDELNEAKLFEVALEFIHPQKLSKLLAEKSQKEKKIKKLGKYADLSRNFFYFFTILLLITVTGFSGQKLFNKIKERNSAKFLLAEIGKREELVANGHFVTACELVEKYLKYFPDDMEIRAFRERLLDFTNNDPKTAQTAYVEAEKLKARLKRAPGQVQKALLSGDEKENLKALLPYHPDLNEAYNQLIAIEERGKRMQSLSEQKTALNEALKRGNPDEAKEILAEMEKNGLNADEYDEYREKTNAIDKACAEGFAQVRRAFIAGKIAEGKKSLNEFLKKYKDYQPARALLDELQNINLAKPFLLKFSEKNLRLTLFFKEQISMGRKDEALVPDIAFDDRRISRNHLIIKRENGQVLVIDKGSTGGTYLDGHKIEKAPLNDRAVLNLAKIKEFKVLLQQTDGGAAGGVLLCAKEENYGLIFSAAAFNLKDSEIYNQSEDYRITAGDGMALMAWKDDFILFSGNKKISTPHGALQLEVL
jgi:pentatricopeptide repeat protein